MGTFRSSGLRASVYTEMQSNTTQASALPYCFLHAPICTYTHTTVSLALAHMLHTIMPVVSHYEAFYTRILDYSVLYSTLFSLLARLYCSALLCYTYSSLRRLYYVYYLTQLSTLACLLALSTHNTNALILLHRLLHIPSSQSSKLA